MNIILIIADSLTSKIEKKMNFHKLSQITYENHWTNATWTVPSSATIITGKIPLACDPVYGKSPHKLLDKEVWTNEVFINTHRKYYTIISSPWEMFLELFIPIKNFFGSCMLKTCYPYVNVHNLKDSYYKRRFKNFLSLDFENLPKPFFHIFHYTKTHSEFNLSPNIFLKKIKDGKSSIEKMMLDTAQELDYQLLDLVENAPDETLFILTSDHGEDYDSILNYECGHGTVFSEEVMRVPLSFLYKGKTKINKEKIEYLTTHQELNECISFILKDKKIVKLKESKKNILIWTQGPYSGSSSIKFLEDPLVGVSDFKENIIYTQSMNSGKEYIYEKDSRKIIDNFNYDKEYYRNIINEEVESKIKKENTWESSDIHKHYGEL